MVADDMVWTANAGAFHLAWQDYCWAAHANWAERIVSTKRLTECWLGDGVEIESERGLWWAMNRNMRDLKQP